MYFPTKMFGWANVKTTIAFLSPVLNGQCFKDALEEQFLKSKILG